MTLRQWFNENQQVRAFYSTRSQITLHCSADDTECGRNFIIFEFFLSKAPGSVRLSLRSTELPPIRKCCISSPFLGRSTSITASFSVNVDWMAPMLGQLNIENGANDSGLTRGSVEDFEEVLWLGFQHSGH